jgi:hypothetical protein
VLLSTFNAGVNFFASFHGMILTLRWQKQKGPELLDSRAFLI